MDEQQVHRPATGRELAIAGVIIAVGLVTALALTGGFSLMGRHPWLDEVLTALQVADPSWRHFFTALAGGVDTNPPTYISTMRVLSVAFEPSMTMLRVTSMIFFGLALWGLYATLRYGVRVLPSTGGLLALSASPLVLRQALEARFYAPMLALAAWLAWAVIAIDQSEAKQVRRQIWLGVLSALLCTIHYFGVFAWLVIVATGIFSARRGWRWAIRNYMAALAGPAALLACVPLFLSQRSAVGPGTWVAPLNMLQLERYAVQLLPWPMIGAVVVCWVLGRLLIQRDPSEHPPTGTLRGTLRTLAPLLACLGVAIIVLIFSAVVQPALISRYALVAALGVAASMAILVRSSGQRAGLLACLALGAISVYQISYQVKILGGFSNNVDAAVREARERTREAPMGFAVRQILYPVWFADPSLTPRIFYWDSPANTNTADPQFFAFERHMANIVRHYYPVLPVILDQTQTVALGHFFIWHGETNPAQALGQAKLQFPGCTATLASKGDGVVLLEIACSPR